MTESKALPYIPAPIPGFQGTTIPKNCCTPAPAKISTERMPEEESAFSVGQPVDVVNKPPHYKQGGLEVIKILRAKLSPEEFKGFCKGNILKYVMRSKYKNGVEDLKKAQVYLKWLIEAEEKM